MVCTLPIFSCTLYIVVSFLMIFITTIYGMIVLTWECWKGDLYWQFVLCDTSVELSNKNNLNTLKKEAYPGILLTHSSQCSHTRITFIFFSLQEFLPMTKALFYGRCSKQNLKYDVHEWNNIFSIIFYRGKHHFILAYRQFPKKIGLASKQKRW